MQGLKSQSRRPKQAGSPYGQAVIDRILAIRDDPPLGLNRTPGSVTIKYYLNQQQQQEPLEGPIPSSTSTIWRILDEHQRLIWPGPIEKKEATEPTQPMEVWQIDFKDVTTVNPEPAVKQQHLVETLNIVDTGTSILAGNPARQDFNAETVISSINPTPLSKSSI